MRGKCFKKKQKTKTLIKNKLKNAASVCAALCEAELKTEAAAGDQNRNDLLLKGTHKKEEEDESEQNERKTNRKHVRNEKTNIMKQTRLGSLKKCSGEFRRPLVEGGGTTSQMYPFYLDEEGLRGGGRGRADFFSPFFIVLFVTPLKMYMGITSKLVNKNKNKKNPLAIFLRSPLHSALRVYTRRMKHH